jgi:hypothetical protein
MLCHNMNAARLRMFLWGVFVKVAWRIHVRISAACAELHTTLQDFEAIGVNWYVIAFCMCWFCRRRSIRGWPVRAVVLHVRAIDIIAGPDAAVGVNC